jgi:hypothetical protein
MSIHQPNALDLLKPWFIIWPDLVSSCFLPQLVNYFRVGDPFLKALAPMSCLVPFSPSLEMPWRQHQRTKAFSYPWIDTVVDIKLAMMKLRRMLGKS